MADYITAATDTNRRGVIFEKAVECLSKFEFDTIVVTGVSGLVVGPVIAHMMDKNLVVIRKDGDGSHSTERIEGRFGKRYVILDDFICSGKTVKRILAEIEADFFKPIYMPVCVGMYCYWLEWQVDHSCQRKCKDLGVQCLNFPYEMAPQPEPPQPEPPQPEPCITPLPSLVGFTTSGPYIRRFQLPTASVMFSDSSLGKEFG